MSERGSFWSTMPGFVTGAAGLLTALVGLLGLSVQLGWIGGGGSGAGNGTSTTVSTVPGASTTVAAGSATTVAGSSSATKPAGQTGTAQFTVEPTSVDFTVGAPRQATVKVRNTGEVPLTVKAPTVNGSGATHFVAGDVNCTGQPLAPGRSCELQVVFAPKAGGAVSAVVAIAAAEAPKQIEVQVKGSSLLG